VHVLATAGHVDHGKSALVRALTGMEPDRYAEERRRGLTLDLGFVWMTLPTGERVAFVDVPGHERFVTTMLAGVGPVPAVLLVVAADGGWSAQTQEHLSILDAWGVRAGLVVVTRCDLADPGELMDELPQWLAGTCLAEFPAVSCSSVTGQGMDELRDALALLVNAMPAPEVQAPTRLWIDRVFTIRGAGTVVTGTLAAGRIAVGDELVVPSSRHTVTVRGLQTLNEQVSTVEGVARVAINHRGVTVDELVRGDALLTRGAWAVTDTLDVVLSDVGQGLAAEMTMHIGAGAIPARTRRLGDRGVRLSLRTPAAVAYGDRILLRDPGSRRVVGGDVVDPLPTPLPRRRGAALRRGDELAQMAISPDPDAELERRGIERRDIFITLGVGLPKTEAIEGWLVAPRTRSELSRRIGQLAAEHRRLHPLDAGMAAGAVSRTLGLPDPRVLPALLQPPWKLVGGRVTAAETSTETLPGPIKTAIDAVRNRLADNPFDAPTPAELAALELTSEALAAAVRAGQLISIGGGVFLTPEAPAAAAVALGALDQPFSTSRARTALQTSRRVVLALLLWLDATGVTRRLPDDRRELCRRPDQSPLSN